MRTESFGGMERVFVKVILLFLSIYGRREVIELKGACNQTSCVGDVIACKPLSSTTHTCICTHDSQPPFADGNCPRKVITSGVDESSGRIPVQPIASHESRISVSHPTNPPQIIPEDKSAAMSTEEHHIDYKIIIPSVLVGIVGIIVICIVVILVIKKKHIKREESSPISLKHNILIPERYAPNPQYAACSTADVPILQRDSLKFLQEIGEGCFGRVFRGELLCTNGSEVRTVAIKVLKESASREAEEDFVREVEIMSAFKHPNILSLLGVVFKDENVTPMMVFEFMPHGDLAELLRSQKQSIWEKEVPEVHNEDLCSIALQIASGMKYLASQRFVHRDLACRNCLVSEGPIVKIADFGMSRDVYTCDYYKIGGSRLLPVRWMSPESVVYGRFTLESDVWSYGVVLWEIFSFGKQPYYGHSNDEVVKLILDGIMLIPPKDCPAYICELMKNCWKTDPRHRITFAIICDKLEEIFKLKESTFKFETVRQKMKVGSNKSLPRPPPIQSLGNVDLLDGQGYLKPIEISEPVTYLETICD